MTTRPATLLHQLDAWQAAALLARREITAVDLVRACLDRIAEREPQLQAFACLGAGAGPVRGLLHGLPFGVGNAGHDGRLCPKHVSVKFR